MARFGAKQFMVAGHDRGGRVVHRMMLDHPDVVTKGAVLDVAPTLTMYDDTSKEFATKYVWWFLQIQPAPMPEHQSRDWRAANCCCRGRNGNFAYLNNPELLKKYSNRAKVTTLNGGSASE
jgi:pimeloyl-ACP methyl ester carboxylesterase